jgi:hypothetical protein
MDSNTKWYINEQINKTKIALENNNYEVFVEEDSENMIERVIKLIDKESTVSFGGSMTLIDSGLLDRLRNENVVLLDRYKEELTKEDINRLYRETFFSDYYLTSSNAITENGELVNLDGNGNRVAAMIFGPKKVIIIAGYNKIVKNIDEAYERVREYAAPVNAKRLNKKTPCGLDAQCYDCASPERICNHYVITYRQNVKGRAVVILVKEEIGY